MKNKISLIVTLLLWVNAIGQTNLITNGGFENGPNGYPNDQSQFDNPPSITGQGPYNWYSQLFYSGPHQFHSPDWYGVNYTNLDADYSGGAHSGTNYLGMGDYELVEQPISGLVNGQAYIISMNIQLSNHVGYLSMGNISNSGYLNVMLSDDEIEYDGNNSCDDAYKRYKSNTLHRDIASFNLSSTLYPLGQGWYKACMVFRVPEDNLDWIIFEVNSGNCLNAYVLLDDIKVQSICSLPCIPSSASEHIKYTKDRTNWNYNNWPNGGLTGPDAVIIHNPPNPDELRTPWHLYIKNANLVEFTVLDRWGLGNIEIHNFSFSPMTLNDPVTEAFLLVWQGDNHAYHTLPLGTYPFQIKMWNCVDDITINGDISLFYNENAETFFEEYMIWDYEVPTGCCLARSYIQNRSISNYEEDQSNDFTSAGSNVWYDLGGNPQVAGYGPYPPPGNGPVIILSGADVHWTSENLIQLNDGFSAEYGSSFEANIDPCGNRNIRVRRNTKIEQFENNLKNSINLGIGLKVYPNPSSGIFILEDAEFNLTKKDICVKDILGKKVWECSNIEISKTKIDISSYPKGVYIIEIIQNESTTIRKVVYN